MTYLFVLGINPLSLESFANISFHAEGCLSCSDENRKKRNDSLCCAKASKFD